MRRFALLFALLPLSAAAASAVDSLRHFFQEVHTYSAAFEQVVLDEGLNPLQETSGRMWIQRPGRFRWEYDPPYRQLIVGDGKRVWVYDIDLEQITVRRMSGALGETPAILLAGRGDLKDSFEVKSLGRQGLLEWVQMIPKRRDGGFEDIRIGFQEGMIRTLEMVDGLGQITRITLRGVSENPELDEGLFVFTPPAGVDVLGEEGSGD